MRKRFGKTTNQVHFPKDETSLTRQIVDGVTREGLWTGEFAYICKDGSRGICELTARPMLDSQGQLIGAIGVNRDVTERKRLEAEREQALAEVLAARAQLQVVLDVLPVAVGITDAEGTGIILIPLFGRSGATPRRCREHSPRIRNTKAGGHGAARQSPRRNGRLLAHF